MPDRPGALGQVASRIGAVRGDVLAIEILEHGAGRAIDELMVSLPDEKLISLLTAEVDAVDGVSVESIRVVDEDRTDPSLAALALCAAVAESAVRRAGRGARRRRRADHRSRLGGRDRAAGSSSNTSGDATRPAAGCPRSSPAANISTGSTTPHRAIWCGCTSPASGLTLAAGRAGHPIHERERVRVSLVGRLADTLLDLIASSRTVARARSVSAIPVRASARRRAAIGRGARSRDRAVRGGRELGVALPARADRRRRRPHTFGESGEERGTERRRLPVDGSLARCTPSWSAWI